MGPRMRVLGGACLLAGAAGALLLAREGAAAAKAPLVSFAWEGRSPADDPLLVLEGKGLRSVVGATLSEPDGDPAGVLGVISPGSTTVKLLLPPALPPGEYDLRLQVGKDLEEFTVRVLLSGGKALPGSLRGRSLHASLRADLDDAVRLRGRPAAVFRDAGAVASGHLLPARFGSLADLEEEGAVAEGRFVTPLFSAWEDLTEEGFVEGALSPLLAGMGTDGAVVQGTLSKSLFSAWRDLEAEGRVDGAGELPPSSFSAWADLEAEGNAGSGQWAPGRLLCWDDLLAEGLRGADGLLKPERFSAWDDLVAEDRVGPVAGKAAPGVHGHDDLYVDLSGDAMTGPLKVEGGTSVPSGQGAIDLQSRAEGFLYMNSWGSGRQFGVRATNGSSHDGSAALLVEKRGAGPGMALALFTGLPDHGMVGRALSATGTNFGFHIEGTGPWLRGFRCSSNGSQSKVLVRAETTGGGGAALRLRAAATSADILKCVETASTWVTRARIDGTGKGWFNGGTATGGADFAESVRASPAAGIPGPGDVVVIDRSAVRGFALCAERMSPLVAGVVSTRPGVLAAPRNVSYIDTPADEIPLAIAGIVPVKVCCENGPVAPGDALAASSLPGYAMRAPADAPPGTVVGKALGSHAEGLGTVEVLLTLR